jgi:uroporphyrinogen III methyltransferase / synthase
MTGIVYLIGAGPGDPGLITVRGLGRLQSADVVIYDHRVHHQLLGHAREGAERIDVGAAAPKPLEQEAICYLLAEKAREGRAIARLKWGDPFFFDHGGTEALFLHEQGVPFEVVPGVPAGIGAPGYAGIPVTYPGGGDVVAFVRGHEGDGQRSAIDWSSLAHLDGTIVCHAGSHQAATMVEALLAHGRPRGDAAALIYDGTLPTQHTVEGTLADLSARAESLERRPAILVVGRVAALREHLRWFDVRPLFGRRVLVTRARERSRELVERLERAGAEAVVAPMIRIAPPEDYAPLDLACAAASEFDWVIFSSANAVEPFIGRLLAGPRDLRALGSVKLCAVGPATAERLAGFGLKVDLIPAEYRAESVLESLASVDEIDGLRVLLPRADIGRELVADELRRRGALVTEVIAYRTVTADPEREGFPDVYRLLLERRIDVVTFASPSAVRNMVRVLGDEPAVDLLNALIVACIGPVTAEAAAQFNIRTDVMPSEHTIPGLVNAIVEYFRDAQRAAARGERP